MPDDLQIPVRDVEAILSIILIDMGEDRGRRALPLSEACDDGHAGIQVVPCSGQGVIRVSIIEIIAHGGDDAIAEATTEMHFPCIMTLL
jgi:hypothetical protein